MLQYLTQIKRAECLPKRKERRVITRALLFDVLGEDVLMALLLPQDMP